MTLNAYIPGILRCLGVGKGKRFILSSISLVIITYFYFFVIGSVLGARIYVFQYRVTYENIFNTHITTVNTDTLILFLATIAWFYLSVKSGYKKLVVTISFSIFLVLFLMNNISAAQAGAALSLPLVTIFLILNIFKKGTILKHDTQLSSTYITVGAIALAASGIISLLQFIATGVSIATTEQYPYAVYQELLSILSPAVMAVLVFCLPLKVFFNVIVSNLKLSTDKLLFSISNEKASTKHIALCLSLCISLGIGLILIAHTSVINPNNQRLGVDSLTYVDWLRTMKNQTENPVYFALKSPGDRPLTLIILFLFGEMTKVDPFQVVEYSPLVLVALLIIVTFFITRQLTANDKISIIAAFLSAISFQTLIGIYSGFYANWLALVLGYFALGLVVKYLKSPSKSRIVTLALATTGVLLAHLYTWSIIISVAFVFLFVIFIFNYYPRKRIIVVCLILSSSIAVDILKSSWTGSSTGIEADISLGRQGLGISQFGERLKTLAETVQTYYGGAYANIAILGLVMYWLVRCKIRELANIFVFIFLSSALVPLFLGDVVLQSRVLYNIPFQIPAAISLYAIWKQHHKIIFIAILLIGVYLSLHVLDNLGYVPPRNPMSIIQE